MPSGNKSPRDAVYFLEYESFSVDVRRLIADHDDILAVSALES